MTRPRLLTVLTLACLAAAVARALLGDLVITPDQALAVLRGDVVPGASYVLLESTLPRAAVGVLAGFAFGLAGALFQTVLRNPLASPDVVGVGMGASAAAVVGIVVLGLSGGALSVLAVAGALGTAVLVRLLAGGTDDRLVLVGVGTASVLGAGVQYLFTRADVHDTQVVLRWLTGSLAAADPATVTRLAPAVAVALVLVWLACRDLPAVELGPDLARGLGAHRYAADALLAAAVVLVGLAVAATGPLAFVALLSGPVARALGRGRTDLLAAGLVGAVVVLLADLVGETALPETNLPAGVVTGLAGAPALLWLLLRGRTEGTR